MFDKDDKMFLGEDFMLIDEKLLTYLEDLSCLKLSSEEKSYISQELGEILSSMKNLVELNT